MEAARQMPNLQAGFKNNIGPAQMQIPHYPQNNPQTAILPQQLVYPQQTQMVMPQGGGVGEVDNGLIDLLGMSFQKKYFYIFLIIIALIAGYFLWKWYNNKGKGNSRNYDPDEEDDDIDPNMFGAGDPQQQMMMSQMLQQQMLQQQLQQQQQMQQMRKAAQNKPNEIDNQENEA
jgi:hypothetical protein